MRRRYFCWGRPHTPMPATDESAWDLPGLTREFCKAKRRGSVFRGGQGKRARRACSDIVCAENAAADQPPCSAKEVDGSSVERIVDLKPMQEAASRVVDNAPDGTNHKRHPRGDDGARSRYAHEPSCAAQSMNDIRTRSQGGDATTSMMLRGWARVCGAGAR